MLVLDPRCLSRRVLRAIFTALFAQAKRLTAEVEPDNRRALRQVQRLGFATKGYRPLGLEGARDTIVYGMLREDCRYLPGYDADSHAAHGAGASGLLLREDPLMVSQPSSPDPYATAGAQNAQNSFASQFSGASNNANEINPYGSVSYNQSVKRRSTLTARSRVTRRSTPKPRHSPPISKSCSG